MQSRMALVRPPVAGAAEMLSVSAPSRDRPLDISREANRASLRAGMAWRRTAKAAGALPIIDRRPA
jgi:hypothetical protein